MGKLFGGSGSSNASKRPSSGGRGARRPANKTRPKNQPETSLLGDLISPSATLSQETDFQYLGDNTLANEHQQPPTDLLAGLDLMGDASLHKGDNDILLSPSSGDLYQQDSTSILSPQSSQHDSSSNGLTINLMDTDLLKTNEVIYLNIFFFILLSTLC